jgi:hypothetical protein
MPARKTKTTERARRPARAARQPVAFDPSRPHFGRVEDEKFVAREVDRVLGYLPHPIFGATAFPIRDSGAGKVVLLYKFLEAQCGGVFPIHTQTIGDCESHGWSLAIDLVKATQIQAGAREEFTGQTATEIIYAGSRVEIGKGQCGTQDGSVGAWAAQFAHDYGTLIRAKYPSLDLTTYSGTLAQKLGRPRVGVPDDLEPLAREHPVKTTSLISIYEEARDAIANGYAIAVSSTIGFQMRRDQDGFARPEGKWPHCFPPEVLVDGPRPRPIGTVRTGSIVYGAEGSARTVNEKHERWFEGDLHRVKVQGLPVIPVSDEHPFLVYRPDAAIVGWRRELPALDDDRLSADGRATLAVATARRSGFAYVPAADLVKGDYLCVPKIPAAAPLAPEWPPHERCATLLGRLAPSALLAWWFGLYAADGTAARHHRIGFTLSPGDDIVRCVTGFRALGIEPRVEDYSTYVRIIGDHAALAEAMYSWFGGGEADEKRLPPWLLTWDLAEVLAGYQHGDGGVGKQRGLPFNYVNTTSRALHIQFFRIIATLGHYPMSHTTRPDRPGAFSNAKTGYRIDWRDEPRRKAGRHVGDFYVLPIKSVNGKAYSGPLHNLGVEDVCSYIAGGVAVHNCMCFAGVDDSFRRPGLLCVNSWGPDWISGSTRLDQPAGSFWVDADVVNAMLRMQDSFAPSGYVGYPRQVDKLDYMLI